MASHQGGRGGSQPLFHPSFVTQTQRRLGWDRMGATTYTTMATNSGHSAMSLATLVGGPSYPIGNYTYLDGELHVKLALCADYCIARLRKHHVDLRDTMRGAIRAASGTTPL